MDEPQPRRRGRHWLHRLVCADVVARARGHGHGAGWGLRLQLHRRQRPRAQTHWANLDAHRHRLHLWRDPHVHAHGRVCVGVGCEPRTVSRRQRLHWSFAWRPGHGHGHRVRRFCCHLRFVGGHRRHLLFGGLPRDAAIRLPAIVLHRRHRRRWHARRDAAALHRAGGLRHPHPTRHWQIVHGRHLARHAGHGHVCVDHHGDRAGQTRLVASRGCHHMGAAV